MTTENSKPTFFEAHAALIKGLFIGFLILILLIPTNMVESLIYERESRKTEAVTEVSSKWGNSQSFIGPVLKIPYLKITKTEKLNAKKVNETELVKTIDYMYFLPDKLDINGNISPDKRKRGIYEIAVYKSTLNFKGIFDKISFQKLNITPENIIWKDATLLLTISDTRGLQDDVQLDWNGQKSNFNSGEELLEKLNDANSTRHTAIYTPVLIENGGLKENKFSFSINIKGSESINFIPVGKTSTVHLQSNWPNPSFDGSFLPDKREISESGFNAQWKILHLNRDFPQYWTNNAPNSLSMSHFGVKLISPNDNYQKASRSAKYAILIISLTFLAFFFSEIFNKIKVHPFNYILVGIALCIFYTLLISIAEFLSFNFSYGIAGCLTIGLIFLYSKSIFQGIRPAVVISGMMACLYGFIFVIIQLEDTALLIGSLGIFIILAITMYFSRKIDWQNIGIK